MSREVLPAGLQHPLDQLLHLGTSEHQVGQLVPPPAGDEDPAGIVDPELATGRWLPLGTLAHAL
jgi:hypothetical protein